jgi:hypothetical protein
VVATETPATWGLKTCRTCQIDKPINKFALHGGSKDGLVAVCEDCRNPNRGAARGGIGRQRPVVIMGGDHELESVVPMMTGGNYKVVETKTSEYVDGQMVAGSISRDTIPDPALPKIIVYVDGVEVPPSRGNLVLPQGDNADRLMEAGQLQPVLSSVCSTCGDLLDFTYEQGYIPHDHDTGDEQPHQAVPTPTTPLGAADVWDAADIEDEGDLVEVLETIEREIDTEPATPESLLQIAHQELGAAKGQISILRSDIILMHRELEAVQGVLFREGQRKAEVQQDLAAAIREAVGNRRDKERAEAENARLQNEVRILTAGIERERAKVRVTDIAYAIKALQVERETLIGRYGL